MTEEEVEAVSELKTGDRIELVYTDGQYTSLSLRRKKDEQSSRDNSPLHDADD